MLGMVVATGTSSWYGLQVEPSWFQIHEQPIRLSHQHGEGLRGLRIAQISDIHLGGWMNRARLDAVVDLVLTSKPDFVAITGDFLTRFSDHDRVMVDLAATLGRLASSVPTFAVMGNHDHWHGVDLLRETLADIHIQELRNSLFSIKRGDAVLHLAGVDDVWEKHERLDRVLADIPVEGGAILLAHEPDFADSSSRTGRFDLQISGHSHGGQVVFPFIGAPILPYMGRKYPSGLYQVGSMWQYTNRGVGKTNPPLRFNCPPEITIFSIE
jgi:uncharacterized protein